MTSFNASIMSALDTFNNDYAEARASSGSAPRPPKGVWDNYITDMTIETDDVTMKIGEAEVPAFHIRFKYRLVGDTSAVPPEMEKGQEWAGKDFYLPTGGIKGLPAGVPEGRKTGIRITTERLKGHISTILGSALTGNFGADLLAAKAQIDNQDQPVAVRVECRYRSYEGTNKQTKEKETKTDFEEFLTGRIS